MKSIVVLISGGGSNLQAIMDHIETQRLDITISLVLSNQKEALGLERAAKAGITTTVVDHSKYTSRELFDQAMIPSAMPQLLRGQPQPIEFDGYSGRRRTALHLQSTCCVLLILISVNPRKCAET